MILCLGSAAETVFLNTLEALRGAGVPFHAVDVAQFLYAGELDIPFHDPRAAVLRLHGAHYTVGAFQSAFFRMLDVTAALDDGPLRMAVAARQAALAQLLSARPIPVINPPMGDASNATKFFHTVSCAAQVRWLLPRSCLTNRPEEAQAFIASCPDGAVFKGCSGLRTIATPYDPALHDARLALLPHAPVLFQERIAGPDVRVHVIGDRTLALHIESSALDYRYGSGQRMSPLDLPPAIAADCVRLCREMQMPFIGIDFKIQRATGDWFFLEANTMPGYTYFDQWLDGSIGRALVEWLTSHPAGARA
jgi:glutathione synthase/RimK-type ligase-like ATP-grasp enzyme